MLVLDHEEWRARKAAHETRVDAWVQPHLARRRAGVAHPVEDFLFTYYSQRPAALRRWHPGYGVSLAGATRAGWRGYADNTVASEHLTAQLPMVRSIRALLAATSTRPANLSCFGLHEWAMVYRLTSDDLRHGQWPLRLGARGTDEVVESHRVGCSHFDAFRFFSPEATRLNLLQPGRDDRAAFEQPGCLHAGMDLYKHAFRLTPLIPSEVVADAFELAWDIRILDMRASPYDLRDLGYDPVEIETVEGKHRYVAEQRAFSERAQLVRTALVGWCDQLMSA